VRRFHLQKACRAVNVAKRWARARPLHHRNEMSQTILPNA
jgi:hypothetical protein